MIEIKYRTRVFIDRKTKRITIHAKEIIDKYKDENYKNGKMFRVYANQKINELLKKRQRRLVLIVKSYSSITKATPELKK
jgi:hypothetical protein